MNKFTRLPLDGVLHLTCNDIPPVLLGPKAATYRAVVRLVRKDGWLWGLHVADVRRELGVDDETILEVLRARRSPLVLFWHDPDTGEYLSTQSPYQWPVWVIDAVIPHHRPTSQQGQSYAIEQGWLPARQVAV